MSQLTFADVSRWQGQINWDEFKNHVDAVVIKATGYDGGGYADSQFARNRDEARRVGLPVAFYHYKGPGDAREQAHYLVSQIGEFKKGEFIVLDDENEGKVNSAFDADFIDEIKNLVGTLVPVYSNLSRFQGVDLQPLVDRDVLAYIAKYGLNTGSVDGAGAAPEVEGLKRVAWQYTSAARVPGVSANTVDMNVFYGSVEDWKNLGVGKTVTPDALQVAESQQASGDGTYTVQRGDTLSQIGVKIGVDWAAIAVTNGILPPYTIFPGQKLKVYGGSMGQARQVVAGTSGKYVVVQGDSLSGIGVKTGHDWRDIATVNNIEAPYIIFPGQQLNLPGNSIVTAEAARQGNYTVVSGDSLSVIGDKTGRSWRAIADANGIGEPYVIYPNQVLIIP